MGAEVDPEEEYGSEEFYEDLGAPPGDAQGGASPGEPEWPEPAPSPGAPPRARVYRIRLGATNTIALSPGTLWFGA